MRGRTCDAGFDNSTLLAAEIGDVRSVFATEGRKSFLHHFSNAHRLWVCACACSGDSEWLQTDKQVLGQVPIPAEAASQALQKGLGVEKAHEVVRKNPGVLAIRVVPSEFNYCT